MIKMEDKQQLTRAFEQYENFSRKAGTVCR